MKFHPYRLLEFGWLQRDSRRALVARRSRQLPGKLVCVGSLLFLAACATPSEPTVKAEGSSSSAAQREAQKTASLPEVNRHKRKIAIGRFTNETRYGRSLLRSVDGGTQLEQTRSIPCVQPSQKVHS